MNNRTHMCGEVTAEVAGQSVILKGWVQRARNLGGIVFVWLRDRTGIVQVVFDGNDISKELLELAESLRSEYVIEVQTETLAITAAPLANGYVKARTGDSTTDTVYTGWYTSVYMPTVTDLETSGVQQSSLRGMEEDEIGGETL